MIKRIDKKKSKLFIVFILSGMVLLISLRLFWNMGIYVDEHNTTPSVISGSDFWLYMDWLRLVLLTVIFIISATSLFHKER
ncbi:MAG: hypothetical protein N4A68_13220 [Maledivibacter sp.]|jgi:uncharacterized membrane protein|nr:hypothetical protein [Maledivibacter sp.]